MANKTVKAQSGVNVVDCRVQVGVDDRGKPVLCHRAGFVPVTLRQLAKIRCGIDLFVKKHQFSCGHFHDVRLVR